MTDIGLDIPAEEVVAEIFGLELKTLRNWATQGYGPTQIPVGRNAFYRKAEVRAWFCTLADKAAAQMKAKNPLRRDFRIDADN